MTYRRRATIAARAAGVGVFSAYPTLHAPVGPREIALAGAIVVVALAPLRRPPGDRAVNDAVLRLEDVTYRYGGAAAPSLVTGR